MDEKTESAVSHSKTISTIQKLLGEKYKIELLWYIGKCDVRRFVRAFYRFSIV